VKRTRAKDSSSIFFISKWVIIVALVIVSSLGFILGYYVGKHDQPSDTNQSSIVLTDKSSLLNDKEPIDQEISQKEQADNQDVHSQTASGPLQDSQNNTESIQTADAKHGQNTHELQKPQTPRKGTTNITYTVQAGAFKSSHEAGILKDKLAKKGYTAYIIQSESKKHERLYKVMIGKFTTRKQAEVLSLKIKKSEGLQTFVTFRTKEDILR
jgi:cell division septation protein DedD